MSRGGDVVAEAIRLLDAATDVDVGAVDLHEAWGAKGALPARIRTLGATGRCIGSALPVHLPPGDNLWLHRAIVQAEPGEVIVAAPHLDVDAGYFGEIMAVAAIQRGVAGLVIDGQVRDRSTLLEMDFPVYCTGTAIRATTKDPDGLGAVGAPLAVGEAVVRRGDLVVADDDGVAVVARDAATRVVAGAIERRRNEREILARLRAGESTMEIFGLPEDPGGS